MTYQDWQDWKQLPMTKAFFDTIVEAAENSKYILIGRAGIDSTNDNFHRGYIMACRDMLNARMDESEQEVIL